MAVSGAVLGMFSRAFLGALSRYFSQAGRFEAIFREEF